MWECNTFKRGFDFLSSFFFFFNLNFCFIVLNGIVWGRWHLHSSPSDGQLDGLRRSFSWHRHCYFGYFHSGLHATLRSPVGRNVGISVLAVWLEAIVQLLGTAPAGMAGAEEGMPQVLAPQRVDDWVDGGVEQAEHAAESKHCLDVIIHPPEEVIDHDGEHWAPADDQHHQDEHQGLGQADVHACLFGACRLHFSPICWVNNEALLGGAAQHSHSVVVCFPQDVYVGVDNEKNQHAGDTDPEQQVVLINQREYVWANRVETFTVPAQQR